METNYYGICYNPQKESESNSEVYGHLSSLGEVSRAISHVPALFSIQEWILQLCKPDEPVGKGCCPFHNNSVAIKQLLSHLQLPTDAAVAGKKWRNLPLSKNHLPYYEEIWFTDRNPQP